MAFSAKSFHMILLATFVVSDVVFATTLPKARGPAEISKPESKTESKTKIEKSSVDRFFDEWLKEYTQSTPITELRKEDLAPWTKTLDATSAVFANYVWEKYNSPKISDSSSKALMTVADQQLQILNQKVDPAQTTKPESPHLLAANVFALLSEEENVPDDKKKLYEAAFLRLPPSSCAQKDWLVNFLEEVDLADLDDAQLRGILRDIGSYQTIPSIRKALEVFFAEVPQERLEALKLDILPVAARVPRMIEKHSWLHSSESMKYAPQVQFKEYDALLKRGRCSEGANQFIAGLPKKEPLPTLKDASDFGREVEKCYGSGRRTQSFEFWRSAQPVFQQAYGDKGYYSATIRAGYILWLADKLDQAIEMYRGLYDRKSKDLLPEDEAKILFVLGRLSENNDDFAAAVKYLEEYVSRFPNHEDFEAGLTTLVTSRATLKQWKQLEKNLDDYVKSQSLLAFDQRSISNNSLALFWLGRAYLSNGKRDLAVDSWRRLASEYYSTFYGAMGHYMLEKTTGKSFSLEPSRVPTFRPEMLFANLTERNHYHASRAKMFLKLGMRASARCEVREMDTTSNAPEQLLGKTVLLFASDAWLEAIKVYDSIPRSFRNSLPVGFERMLFPQNFGEYVVEYAKKLNMDPDLVFAIIRQESVFDPQARSQVGATGLMQLMPQTAQHEISKMSKGYISNQRRMQIQRGIRLRKGLEDPETNIILGTHHIHRLLQIYKSPVLALSAYNANPAAAERWKRNILTDDYLVFIERIPYRETRAYVKLILRNYFYYKRWYGTPAMKDTPLDFVASQLLADIRSYNKEKEKEKVAVP